MKENIITAPQDFTFKATAGEHEIKAGQKIEIYKNTQYFEQIGKRVFKVLKDFDNGDLSLSAGQMIRIVGAE